MKQSTTNQPTSTTTNTAPQPTNQPTTIATTATPATANAPSSSCSSTNQSQSRPPPPTASPPPPQPTLPTTPSLPFCARAAKLPTQTTMQAQRLFRPRRRLVRAFHWSDQQRLMRQPLLSRRDASALSARWKRIWQAWQRRIWSWSFSGSSASIWLLIRNILTYVRVAWG